MNWTSIFSARNLVFAVGAIGAVAKAIELAQQSGAVTPAHLIAVACVAACAFAMKWPGDVTASDAKEIEARALRQSIAPPPRNDGGSHGP